MPLHRRPTALMTLALPAVMFGSGASHAAGFALIEQNASGLGNAYAGAAALATDASTIYFNPAGMTLLPARQLVGALHAVNPQIEFSDADPATPNGGDAGSLAVIPNVYFATALGDLRLGVGVSAQLGLKTEYDAGWLGRFAAIKSELTSVNVNPALAMKLTPTLSVGVGVSVDYVKATLSNATPAFGRATVEGDDVGYGANAGLLWQATPATRLGLAYRSEIRHTLEGDVSFSAAPPGNGPVRADTTFPAQASLSLVHQLNPAVQLLADASWTGWQVFDRLRVVRSDGMVLTDTVQNWDDAWRFSLGTNWRQSDTLTWRFGVARDQSPVATADRNPRIPDADRVWLAFGAGWQWRPATRIDVGYAHVFIDDAQQPARPAEGLPAGRYELAVDILGAQLTQDF